MNHPILGSYTSATVNALYGTPVMQNEKRGEWTSEKFDHQMELIINISSRSLLWYRWTVCARKRVVARHWRVTVRYLTSRQFIKLHKNDSNTIFIFFCHDITLAVVKSVRMQKHLSHWSAYPKLKSELNYFYNCDSISRSFEKRPRSPGPGQLMSLWYIL